jgi:hypothetical protein
MDELFQHLVDAPIANLIVLAGLAFVFIAAVGKIADKIEPDTRGRIACGVLGLVLIPGGIFMHALQEPGSQPPHAAGTAPQSTPGPGPKTGCKTGYVPRRVVPNDKVCVTKETQYKVIDDNRLAPSRTTNGGAYGADTCRPGFVWREAVPEDHVCVSPETRTETRQDNLLASTRRAP